MDITIFLTDTADGYNLTRNLIFREWDGTRGDAEARMASAGEDGTITLTLTEDPHETVTDTLERVYAAANGMPNLIDVDVRDAYYANEVRSLSVGDIVHVPGEGLFAVARAGFTRMHLHLPSDDFSAERRRAHGHARRGPETDFFRIRSLATGDLAAMRFGGTESAERFMRSVRDRARGDVRMPRWWSRRWNRPVLCGDRIERGI